MYLRSIRLDIDDLDLESYPFSIAAVAALNGFEFHDRVTFIVGENGSGKSTMIEAVASVAGFNVEGGTRSFNFATTQTESELSEHLTLTRSFQRERDGFFLRAESFYNVATEIDALGAQDSYGGSLHTLSHGEAFLQLMRERFRAGGLYIMDEPESALSPARQLSFLYLLDDLVQNKRCQFVIATHSPIIMAYPDAEIQMFSEEGITRTEYEETEHYRTTLDFLSSRQSYFRHLFHEE